LKLKVEIELSEEEKKDIEGIWKFTKERMNEETRKVLGWDSMQDFLRDVLRFGLEKSSDDPISFIQSRILQRFPVVRKEELTRFREELAKIYG